MGYASLAEFINSYATTQLQNMNPYTPPETQSLPDAEAEFNMAHWWVHSWSLNGDPVTVLHREPFRLKWFATQLVTFVFVINHKPEDITSIDADYAVMRKFASQHKRTWIPFALQCGYALLPIYIGESFSDSLIDQIQNRFKKRWCVFHVPSLLDSSTGTIHTLDHKSFWGCVYRKYVQSTVVQVADAVEAGKLVA